VVGRMDGGRPNWRLLNARCRSRFGQAIRRSRRWKWCSTFEVIWHCTYVYKPKNHYIYSCDREVAETKLDSIDRHDIERDPYRPLRISFAQARFSPRAHTETRRYTHASSKAKSPRSCMWCKYHSFIPSGLIPAPRQMTLKPP
jgi:hypothetical protein